VSLNRLAGEPVDLLINGKPIARGEVVVIDEEFGLRITDVVAGSRAVEDEGAAQAAAAAQAEADLLAHVGGPDPYANPDPLGAPAPDPLGGGVAVPDPLGGSGFAQAGPDPLGTPAPDPLGNMPMPSDAELAQ
jgi:hypothetical protein